MSPTESLTPEMLEATLRFEAIRTAEYLINQVSQSPGHPYGDWAISVMPEGNAVIFGRGDGTKQQPAQSIILNQLGGTIHVHAYDSTRPDRDTVELRSWHSVLTEAGDVHESSLEITRQQKNAPQTVQKEAVPPFTLEEVHSIIHSIANEQGRPAPAVPQTRGWLQNLKLVTK